MKCIIDAATIGQYIDYIRTTADESRLRFDDDGMHSAMTDPANVSMSLVDLEKEAFERYDVHADSGVEIIGLNLERFADVVGMAESGDIVQFELDPETRKLDIQVSGLHYTLALIDPESIRQEPDLPDLELPAEVILEAGELKRGIKASDMVSNHVRLGVDDEHEQFLIEAEGDTDDVTLRLGRDRLIDLTPAYADSLFSLDYMSDFCKEWGATQELTIELGEEFPTVISYEFAERHGTGQALLAPRIQSD